MCMLVVTRTLTFLKYFYTHTHTVNKTVANFDGLSSDDVLKLVDDKTFLSES